MVIGILFLLMKPTCIAHSAPDDDGLHAWALSEAPGGAHALASHAMSPPQIPAALGRSVLRGASSTGAGAEDHDATLKLEQFDEIEAYEVDDAEVGAAVDLAAWLQKHPETAAMLRQQQRSGAGLGGRPCSRRGRAGAASSCRDALPRDTAVNLVDAALLVTAEAAPSHGTLAVSADVDLGQLPRRGAAARTLQHEGRHALGQFPRCPRCRILQSGGGNRPGRGHCQGGTMRQPLLQNCRGRQNWDDMHKAPHGAAQSPAAKHSKATARSSATARGPAAARSTATARSTAKARSAAVSRRLAEARDDGLPDGSHRTLQRA